MKPNAKFQTCVPSNVMIARNHLLNSNYHCDAHLLNRKFRDFLKRSQLLRLEVNHHTSCLLMLMARLLHGMK